MHTVPQHFTVLRAIRNCSPRRLTYPNCSLCSGRTRRPSNQPTQQTDALYNGHWTIVDTGNIGNMSENGKTEGRSLLRYYSQLAFSYKFIIIVFSLICLVSFFFLVWKPKNGIMLEDLARERHAGMVWKNTAEETNEKTQRKPKILRTLAPDLKLAIGQCPHPQEVSPALLQSIRKLDNDPVCKKALFGAACQLEKGLLYDTQLTSTCSKGEKTPEIDPSAPRILFVIDANSAGARQVERLLIHVYHKMHFYLLLIPNCYRDQLEGLISRIGGVARNVRFLHYEVECPKEATAEVNMPGTPDSFRFILHNTTEWNWNYLLSLDSFDFPLLNVHRLTQFLIDHFGTNFLESYAMDEKSDYIRNVSSEICGDGNRWPIGQGTPPIGLHYYLGPPWYLLTRQFLRYALFSEKDKLVNGLTKYAKLTNYPAQLLFHTLAHNGPFCQTFVNESLRLTKYHIFDQRAKQEYPGKLKMQEQEQLSSWTFSSKDYIYFSNLRKSNSYANRSSSMLGQKFLGRRFDPTISQQIIYDLESTLYEDTLFPIDTAQLHGYWQTLWTRKMKDNRPATVRYAAVARLVGDLCTKRLQRCSNMKNPPVLTELSLYRNFDLNDGLILSMNVSCDASSTIPLECYVNFQHHEKVKSILFDYSDMRNDLVHLKVGSDYDQMDDTFRNYAGTVIVDKHENFGLRTQWIPGELNSQYQFAWLDPGEYVADTRLIDVGPWTSRHWLPKSDDLLLIQFGVWTAAVLSDGRVAGATEFLVLPDTAQNYARIPTRDKARWAKRFFQVNRLCVPAAFARSFSRKCQCAPPQVPTCQSTTWSTLASDPKSNFASFLRNYNEDRYA